MHDTRLHFKDKLTKYELGSVAVECGRRLPFPPKLDQRFPLLFHVISSQLRDHVSMCRVPAGRAPNQQQLPSPSRFGDHHHRIRRQRLISAEVWKFRFLCLEQSELLNSMSSWIMKTGEYERMNLGLSTRIGCT